MPRLTMILYTLILLSCLALGNSCGGGGGGASSPSSMEMIALDSGLDKKSMSDDINEYAGSEDYSSQYRDQTRSSLGSMSAEQQGMVADNGWNNPSEAPAGSTADGETDIPQDGMLRSIEDWLNPKAWAQEASVDEDYIIRTGNIEMEIDDYDKSSAEVTTIARRYGGIITDSQMQKYGDNMRVGWITLRVPSDKFQQCYDDLRAIGEVKVQNVSSEDVTNEYIAGVSRMEALRIEHETLQGMLADAREIQRTRGLGEAYSVLLDTQKRLSQVTTELQTVENRVSSLKDRIQRSTISVNLSERPLAPPPDEFSWGFGNTFESAKKDLMAGVSYSINGLIYFMINGLLWWIIWLFIIWLVWKLVLRRLWSALVKALKQEQERGRQPEAK